MFKRKIFYILAIFLSFLFASSRVLAVDLDDDLKPEENTEHIKPEAKLTPSQSEAIEAKYPQEAQAVRAALARHIGHANALDLEGYLGDFLKERVRDLELDRAYAARAMALKDLKIEVKSIEFQSLSRTTATLHTRQISRYIDEQGQPCVDDVVLSYRWIQDANDQVWRIAFTERNRVSKE